ncbi:hypothetical protein LOZ51_006654 [Ophidiomyces ophidiicola]|nr:hypothetical protein LOZ54_005464 [Ophidiomyces ophidiicola]KAI1984411.1 hypothetical protein LOZ51_006654 [Ophidiomyces ophidiicola]
MTNSTISHPYYPIELQLAGYLANEWSVPVLIGGFCIAWGLILLVALKVVSVVRPTLPKVEKIAVSWFVLSGAIHLFFEGYFVVNHTRMAPAQDLFGQLWKEYSLSDSRYLTSDPFVLCMETITAALWGPLCFIVAYMITMDSPLRHPLQLIVSVGQVYGDILYYSTSLFEHYFHGLNFCRPEAYYFWCYYFFMNFIWIVIPSYFIMSSVSTMSNAIKEVKQSTKLRKMN